DARGCTAGMRGMGTGSTSGRGRRLALSSAAALAAIVVAVVIAAPGVIAGTAGKGAAGLSSASRPSRAALSGSVTKAPFGTLPNGKTVYIYTLTNAAGL